MSNNKKNSITSYSSEFKSTRQLDTLLNKHPRWNELKVKLEQDSTFPQQELPESLRSKDLEAAFIRGNHKSAKTHEIFLANAIGKETKKGWLINMFGLDTRFKKTFDSSSVSKHGEAK